MKCRQLANAADGSALSHPMFGHGLRQSGPQLIGRVLGRHSRHRREGIVVRMCSLVAVVVFTLSAFQAQAGNAEPDPKELAERFFRGVYACDPSVVDDLASEDVIVSYPILQRLFGVPSIRGREAVRAFATGFCERWADAQVTIHEAIAEGDRVVLVWSFRARNVGTADKDRQPTNEEHSWGGISLYYFDEAGRIRAEIGEESEPGPFERATLEGSGE